MSKDNTLPIPYEVGYAKPPAQHRFRKGRSGNPKGRPKGQKAKPVEVNTGLGMKSAEAYLRIEAYRPVTVREGDQVIELPAIQAVFWAMGVAAMKGNRFVQKTLAEMVTRMEAEQHASRLELFETMLTYKRRWDEELTRCRKFGLPEPELIPHPDDIILNPNNGDVSILGPQTKEQKAHYDKVMERRAEAQQEVTYFAERYRRARDPKLKQRYLEEWHWEQRLFDILNDAMPGRYKARLENRSYAEGASREGTALTEVQRNKALRSEYVE